MLMKMVYRFFPGAIRTRAGECFVKELDVSYEECTEEESGCDVASVASIATQTLMRKSKESAFRRRPMVQETCG